MGQGWWGCNGGGGDGPRVGGWCWGGGVSDSDLEVDGLGGDSDLRKRTG